MAKQTGIISFTGKLGNLIGYRRNGQYYLRTMPETVRQTAATRHASRDFGIASRKGKLVRQAVTPHLDISRDGSLVNRLNKTLISAGKGQLQMLNGFRFNRHAGVENFFCQQPVMSAAGVVTIPAQTLRPEGTATHLEVKVIAVRVSFLERRITGSRTASVMIGMDTRFSDIELDVALPGKGTLLVIVQVRSFNGPLARANRRFVAADILAVVPPAVKKQRATVIPDVKKVPRYKEARGKKYNTTLCTPHTVLLHQRE
ncbi:hypothetical protein MRBLMN1_001746 [Chitinophaga ginsengisegetis]|uniref:hypothetical protein n=1 Tax=Chitinophaga ginsengisegetis TaxID=393003 RepID=UPI003435675B